MKRRTLAPFTIMEMMLAITIFALIMIAIYSSWSAILRGSRAALNVAAEVQRTRIAIRALEESLASAQLFVQNIRHYSFIADTSKENAAYLSFVAHLPASFPGSGLFEDQVVRRVTFSVEKGQLLLRQTPLLEVTELVGEPYTIVLNPNIESFDMFFWDLRKGEWLKDWPYTNQLPRMMRVDLGFGHSAKFSHQPAEIISRVVTLNSTAIDRGLGLPAVPNPGNVRVPTNQPVRPRGSQTLIQ